MASITKRGKSYLLRVSCGFDGTGKRITKCHTWTPPLDMTERQAEKEAQRQAVLFEEKCRTGQVLDSNTLFSDFVDVWLKDYAEKQLKPKTLSGYKEHLKRILAAFGNMKLEKIQPHHLNAYYDNLAETGIRADIKNYPHIDFKAYIRERGYTQARLAEKASVALSVPKSCCDGKNISRRSAEKICQALGVSIADIFTPQEDKGLSSKTILHHHRLISTILETAVQWQVLFSNPCRRVKPPKTERKEARYLDEVEASQLLNALQNEPVQYRTAIELLLHTGLRRGELLGLEWQDVDFFTECLHIRRSMLYLVDIGIFEESPKTESSKRVIKLSTSAVELLKQYRTWQNTAKAEIGSEWEEHGKLFTTWNGKPMHPDTLSNWFRHFIKKNSLPNVSIHSLRHTHATLLIASGVPIKAVSSRLGHADLSTTSNIYTHAIRSADEAAAEAIQNILTPTENAKARPIKIAAME